MSSKVYPAMTEEELLKVAETITALSTQQTKVAYLTTLVDQYTEELAWETNALIDMQATMNTTTKEG